jgi:hypothetical protein
MTITKKLITGVALLVAVALIALTQPFSLRANPSEYCINSTNSSTSTVVAMTAGTATTTLTLTNCASSPATDSAFLQFQYTVSSASSTAKMAIRVEHSQDKIDWYPETVNLSVGTSTIVAGDSATYLYQFATTTTNGGSGTTLRVHRSLVISTPTRYTRVVFYVPQGGGAGSLWAQAIGKNQF